MLIIFSSWLLMSHELVLDLSDCGTMIGCLEVLSSKSRASVDETRYGEMEAERAHHQKLVKEHGRLLQR